MSKKFAFLIVSILTLGLVSCASYFKRQDCEKINWFEHGKNVALSGKRLNEDSQVHDCRKVEAKMNETALDLGFKAGMENYCEIDTVYRIGRRGETFNPDLCNSSKLRSLRAKHVEGVREYCRPNNGMAAGATGKAYNNICPKELEDGFLPEFNKGRKKYLTGRIAQARNDLEFAQNDLNSLENQRRDVSYRLTLVQNQTRVRINPPPGSQGASVEISDNSKEEADRLKSDLSDVDYKIRTKRSTVEKLRDEVRTLTEEISKL